MTFTGNGGARVAAPLCEERPFGLFSVAERDERGGFEWARGLEFDELPCGNPGVISMPCPPPPEAMEKAAKRGFDTPTASAFVVYDGWTCAVGGGQAAAAWDNAEALLERTWKWGVERAFWTGEDQDANALEMSLAGGGAEDLTPLGGALDITSGVAALEAYMADVSPCLPTIHANVGVGTYIAERNLLVESPAGSLRLLTGTRLALGGGYTETGPAGDAPDDGEAWIYVSGPVKVTYGPTFFTPDRGDLAGAVDYRSRNDVTVYAEKMVAIQRACGLAAVQVTLNNCCG